MTLATVAWLLVLVVFWAANSVVVKVAVRDFSPFWAAFLRFTPSVPVVLWLMLRSGVKPSVPRKHVLEMLLLGTLMYVQIFLFNYGSQHTSGGRVTLFIFTYPLVVPLVAPLIIRQERYERRAIVGSLIAFGGVVCALWTSLGSGSLLGDTVEQISALFIAAGITLSKRLTYVMNVWNVLFWRFVVAVVLFLGSALLFERPDFAAVRPDAWYAISFQAVVVSIFCFVSFHYLLSRHNSSSVAVFFFATPLAGMVIGMLLMGEAWDWGLLAGNVLVGTGILVVALRKGFSVPPLNRWDRDCP